MKIEHETKGVLVTRYATIASAFAIGLKERRKGIITELERFREPLAHVYEGEMRYTRTLALASLKQEMRVGEFYIALRGLGYYPASMSEDVSFLFELVRRRIKVGTVLHLGTILREDFKEQRLVTNEEKGGNIIDFYPQTMLKSHRSIIVVKHEGIR